MNVLFLRSVFCAGWMLFLILPVTGFAQEKRAPAATVRMITNDPSLSITKEQVRKNRFALKGWKGDLNEARITDLTGNDISGLLAAKTESGAVTMAQPMQPFIMKTRVPQKVILSEQSETMLPGGLVLALATAPDRSDTKAIWFRLFCSISPRPAPWIETAGSYVTQMKFLVRPTEGTADTIALPHPITVSLEFDGMTAQDVPTFTINQAGLENQKVVELRFKPSTMQPKLLVRSTISDSDLTLEALPRLELRPTRTTVLGFGLETVGVAVAQVRADGQPAEVAAATNVDVQVRGTARLEGKESVMIPGGSARAEFFVRSSGLGKVTVQATVGALTATTELNQRFPTGPLIAALLGGALGGLARRWVKGARKRPAARNVFEGVVVGLVAFVAAVLGVGYLNLPAAIAATEAGAFLTGVLCGFAGVTVFSAMTDRMKSGAKE